MRDRRSLSPSASRFVLLLVFVLAPEWAISQTCTNCYAWKPLRIGAGGWVTGLDIAPDGTKVVRTDTYGAYLWDSNTSQWEQLVEASGIPVEDQFLHYNLIGGVWEIRIAPSNSTRLYMAWQGWLYRSDDSGAHWTKTLFPRRSELNPNDSYRTSGQKMAVDPANPDVIYVGTVSSGVWRSYDAGATWARVTAVPAGSGPGHPGITFDASSGTDANGRTKTLYVPSYGNGVWRTTDAGATWAQTSGAGPTRVWHAQVAADGLYYCADGTKAWKYATGTWTAVASGPFQIVVTDPANPARIILAGDGGFPMRASLDRGATWVGNDSWWSTYPAPGNPRVATDIPWLAWTKEDYMSAGDMRIDPTDGKLYFAEGIGVWTTTFPMTFTAFNWTSQSKGIEQLVANWIWSVPGGALFVTSWDRPIFRSANPDVFPSTHGPNRDNSIIYGASVEHAVNNPSFLAVDAGWQSIEQSSYSTDGGASWKKFPTYPPWGTSGLGHIAVSTDQNMVWTPNGNKAGYYTKNRGATWTPLPSPVNGPLDSSLYNNRHILTADRVTPNKFYIYDSRSGLYVSANGGDIWTRVYSGHIVNSADGFNAKLKAVPGRAGHLFYTNGPFGSGDHVGPDSGELFKRSTDGGATWTTVAGVLEVHDFGFGKEATEYSYPTIFIAGFVNRVWGIWRSDDEGQTWTRVGDRPLGRLDLIKAVEGDKNVYGTVYVGFLGSGYAVGVGPGYVGGNPPGTPAPPVLTPTEAGTGSGTVISSAAPATGSSFTGWSGGRTGTGSCRVTMDAAKSINATFTSNQNVLTLAVYRAGDGAGTVTSTPTGIDCGADCVVGYAPGTVVSLTPTPVGGSVFVGWSGACTGAGDCQLCMDAARSVRANFALAMYPLDVSTVGEGSGAVTSAPAGIDCGADCSEVYNRGTLVSLTATPEPGSSFGGWTGGCSGTGSCQPTMDTVKGLVASFLLGSPPPPPGDLNRDGRPDLLWHHEAAGLLYTWFMVNGRMTSGSYLQPDRVLAHGWEIRGLADLNGDTHTDLLWQDLRSEALSVWLMNGTRMVQVVPVPPIDLPAPRALPPGPGRRLAWQVRGLADIDGDGQNDVIWHHPQSGDLYVWFMSKTTPVSGSLVNAKRLADLDWRVRGLGDFNADGKADVLWQDQGTGELYVWFMNGATVVSEACTTPGRMPDTRWQVVRVADFNGEGKPDILWQHQASAELYTWYMDGLEATSTRHADPIRPRGSGWTITPR